MLNFRRALSISIISGILLMHTLYAGKDFEGANWDSYNGFEVSENIKLPQKEIHPSLWLTSNQLISFRKKITADKTVKEYWQKVTNHRYLTMPLPAVVSVSDGKKAVHQYYGNMTQIPLYCAFMYWMTDDEEQKKVLLDRATRALLRAFDGPIFDLDPRLSGIDKSVDEIYRGVWAQSVSAAYDLIQPFLNDKDDRSIRMAILREIQFTHKHLQTWADGPHNHISKPAWGLASFALAFSSHPDAEAWYANAIKAANRNTRYHFSADGIYREGSQYYIFSWINFIPYLYHCRNVAGVDHFKDFMKSIEWSVISRNSPGWQMNIEDSFIRPVPTQMVSSAYMQHTSVLNSKVPFGQVLQWNFQTTDFTPFRKTEAITGFNYTGASWDYPKELYELITYDASIKASKPSIDPTIFMDEGQTFFRNQWTDDEVDQMYLLFHSVPQADNHDHHDTLSFVIYAKGQMMASDSGYTRKGYGDDIRYSYYRQPQAHNTLTFDKIPLGDFTENKVNPSSDRLNTSFVDMETKKAPFRHYLGEPVGAVKRNVMFIQDEYYIISDQVKCSRKGKIRLYFHGGRARLNADSEDFIWTYDEDNYGTSARLLTRQLQHKAKLKIQEGESTYIKGDFKSYPYLEYKKKSASTLFSQVLYPLGVEGEAPHITELSTDSILAAKINMAGHYDLYFISPPGMGGKAGKLSSDGDLAWCRIRSQPVKLLMRGGSKLKYDGKTYAVLDDRGTIALSYTTVSLEVGLNIRKETTVSLLCPDKPLTIKGPNGKIVYNYMDGTLEFKAKDSGNFIIKW